MLRGVWRKRTSVRKVTRKRNSQDGSKMSPHGRGANGRSLPPEGDVGPIGAELRRDYADVVDEPVPDRLLKVLRKPRDDATS